MSVSQKEVQSNPLISMNFTSHYSICQDTQWKSLDFHQLFYSSYAIIEFALFCLFPKKSDYFYQQKGHLTPLTRVQMASILQKEPHQYHFHFPKESGQSCCLLFIRLTAAVYSCKISSYSCSFSFSCTWSICHGFTVSVCSQGKKRKLVVKC